MEDLNAFIRSWAMEEEDDIPFSYRNVFDDYRDPVDPNSVPANFEDILREVEVLLNPHS